MNITGLYVCNCHPFSCWREHDEAIKRKLSIGDKVKQRHTGKEGEIFAKQEEKGYYTVKYGKNKSDLVSEHVAMLIPI